MRILSAGQLVEDIDQYHRIHEMMHVLIASESRENDAAEAFGQLYDDHKIYYTNTLHGIRPLDSLYVLFKPLSGLLNQNKVLP